MSFVFQPINPEALGPLQKEQYNYQKLSAALADHGYLTRWVKGGALANVDVLAEHVETRQILKIQQFSRPTVAQRCMGQDIWAAFPIDGIWYVAPHDDLVGVALPQIGTSTSWQEGKRYYSGEHLRRLLAPYLADYALVNQKFYWQDGDLALDPAPTEEPR